MQASDSMWSANWQKTFFRPRTPPVALKGQCLNHDHVVYEYMGADSVTSDA